MPGITKAPLKLTVVGLALGLQAQLLGLFAQDYLFVLLVGKSEDHDSRLYEIYQICLKIHT